MSQDKQSPVHSRRDILKAFGAGAASSLLVETGALALFDSLKTSYQGKEGQANPEADSFNLQVVASQREMYSALEELEPGLGATIDTNLMHGLFPNALAGKDERIGTYIELVEDIRAIRAHNKVEMTPQDLLIAYILTPQRINNAAMPAQAHVRNLETADCLISSVARIHEYVGDNGKHAELIQNAYTQAVAMSDLTPEISGNNNLNKLVLGEINVLLAQGATPLPVGPAESI
jgi:hypothetical protein